LPLPTLESGGCSCIFAAGRKIVWMDGQEVGEGNFVEEFLGHGVGYEKLESKKISD